MQFGGDESPFPNQQVSWFRSCLFALLEYLIRNDDATVKENDYRIVISAITGNSHPPIPPCLRALNIVSFHFLSAASFSYATPGLPIPYWSGVHFENNHPQTPALISPLSSKNVLCADQRWIQTRRRVYRWRHFSVTWAVENSRNLLY